MGSAGSGRKTGHPLPLTALETPPASDFVCPPFRFGHFYPMVWHKLLRAWSASVICCFAGWADPSPLSYFGIEIVDQDTSRGVPMVELLTTSGVRLYTDSSGLAAFYEPGLMNQKVWFAISAHGYEFAADGFGLRGAALLTKPSGQGRSSAVSVSDTPVSPRPCVGFSASTSAGSDGL